VQYVKLRCSMHVWTFGRWVRDVHGTFSFTHSNPIRWSLRCWWVHASIMRTLSSIRHQSENISKLQITQSLLSRVMFNTHQSNSHMTFQQLHWLPIKNRIYFKIANITIDTLHYSQPAYCVFTLLPVRSLRSSNTNLLTVPFACTHSIRRS